MKLITLFIILIGSVVLAQKDNKYRHFEVGAQVLGFYAMDFNVPQIGPSYYTYGAGLGISLGALQAGAMKMDWLAGYHYVNEYGKYEGSAYSGDQYLPYHGGYTGIGLKFGKRHMLESNLLIGGGMFLNNKPKLSTPSMEISTELGYRFESRLGLLVRGGACLNLGRNGFWSPMYAGYLGVGYVFMDNSNDNSINNNNVHPSYVAISTNAYIGSLNLEVFGIGLHVDHFIRNTDALDIGYSVEIRNGFSYSFESLVSVSAGFSLLAGRKSHKLEMSIGPNFPLDKTAYVNTEFYELLYFGLGYRYEPKDSPFFIRISSATTSVANFGVGFKLKKR